MSIKHILCVSNLSLTSINADYAAVRLAHRFQAKITVLSCGDFYPYAPTHYDDEGMQLLKSDVEQHNDYERHVDEKKLEAIEHFNALQHELGIELGDRIAFVVKLENEVTSTLDLLEEDKEDHFDLIVAGKHHTSWWERFLFGSAGKEICDETKITTLLIPSEEQWKNWQPTGVVVCTSLTHPQKTAQHLGISLAKAYNAPLTLLHVLDIELLHYPSTFSKIFPIDYIPPQTELNPVTDVLVPARENLAAEAKALANQTDYPSIASHLATGKVGEEIVEYLKASDKNNLLIISSSGTNALQRFFLGSNMDAIEAECFTPILLVFHTDL